MSDPILAKSFSRYGRQRFSICAFLLFLITAWSITSTNLKPHLRHPFSVIDAAVNLRMPINSFEEMIGDMSDNVEPTVDNSTEDIWLPVNVTKRAMPNNHETSTTISKPTAIEGKKMGTLCNTTNYCEIEGDIRIQANSSTIFVITSLQSISNSVTVEPYPRKGTGQVKKWTLRLKSHKDDSDNPQCSHNHSHPAILFSVGGFTGNLFHDFADVLFPLYSTSFNFNKEVHFLISDYRQWWTHKYRQVLNRLTQHEMVDIGKEKGQVHCYNRMVAGLKFHKELIMNPSLSNSPAGLSMPGFRQLLGKAYFLKRKRAIRLRKGDSTRPRLMIISRQRTRILTNMGEVARLAGKLGYEVVIEEAGVSTDLSKFAQKVNSCDVLFGIHGAGLTNMVFLADKAVVIQVVPYGGLDGYAKLDFGNPAGGMNLRYLEYKVRLKESSLIQQYSTDDPILKYPNSFKDWSTIWSIYLNKQNVSIDLQRFKGTLVKALRLLRR